MISDLSLETRTVIEAINNLRPRLHEYFFMSFLSTFLCVLHCIYTKTTENVNY